MLSRQKVHRLRQWLQTNLNGSAPTGVTDGQTFEVDEVYQNAGGESTPHHQSDDPPRRRAGYPLGEAIGAWHQSRMILPDEPLGIKHLAYFVC